MPLNKETKLNTQILEKCLGYDSGLHPVVRLQFWSIGEGGIIPSLLLIPGLVFVPYKIQHHCEMESSIK